MADVDQEQKPVAILMVEDNLGYSRLTRDALVESRMPFAMTVVRDGMEALAFLRQEDPYADASLPDLVLLDLNLPKKNGHEVLAVIKADTALKRIPVVILTNSQAEGDISKSYDLKADCYVSKPDDIEQFPHVIKLIRLCLSERGEASEACSPHTSEAIPGKADL